ncbi:MAG: hypothetical protein ACOC2L_01250, partial [Candidatus Sumerlaeota bacterium]
KTASTHIGHLLKELFDGTLYHSRVIENGMTFDKHLPAPPQLLDKKRYFLASIRNPFDWYLSLWAFLCSGFIHEPASLQYKQYKEILDKHFSTYSKTAKTLTRPHVILRKLLKEFSKPTEVWKELYKDSSDIDNFRKWLRLLNAPEHYRHVRDGYGESDVSHFCGFFSYRYLRLCCENSSTVRRPGSFSNRDNIRLYDKENSYIDAFVRQEDLEATLCNALNDAGLLNKDRRELIYSKKKTNTSKRPHAINAYYDEASKDIVQDRDWLIFEKFGYAFPD